MISVIIPLYNKEKYIKSTIKSILSQKYQNFEIIIVDDGSTDNSLAEIERIEDDRIRLIHQSNAGVAAARNRGIAEARGEYVAFLDADDEWKEEYLEAQANMIQAFPSCSVFATNYLRKHPDDTYTHTIIRGLKFKDETGIMDNYFEVATLSQPPVWTSAVVIKKNALESISGFPVGIKSGEDLLTWARLASRYQIAYDRRPLAIFNIEGYDVKEKPKRIPAEDDVVGQELDALSKKFNPPYICKYISLWHQMRSSIYMRLGMRGKSIREAIKGLRYNILNYKLYAFCLINILPSKLQPFR